jgi:outer membrane protein assembly factor BamA
MRTQNRKTSRQKYYNKYSILLIAYLLIGSLFVPVMAVDDEPEKKRDNLRAFPFGSVAYTPELGPTLIGVMMVSFKTDPQDTLIQRSSTPVNLGASLRGSYFMNTIVSTYWLEDRLRIFGELRFRNMPDHYWGVGYDNASARAGRDEGTAYRRAFWKVSPQILWQARTSFFLGVNIDYNRTIALDINDRMAADPDYLEFGPRNFNSGVGLIIRYDSRDIPVNPWSGALVDYQMVRYSEQLGGDNNFMVNQLDIRKFIQVWRPGTTLALRFTAKHTSGNVPYTDLAMVGSPYDLRGYFQGHYRDRSMVLGIAEYRHQFMKSNGSYSRHGAVAWVGAGSLGPSPGSLSKLLPNGGIGYRFEVISRMNVRAEFGFGRQSKGFYFSFNEAF